MTTRWRSVLRAAVLFALVQACNGDVRVRDESIVESARAAITETEEPEPCSTPPRTEADWEAFYHQPPDAQPLDPSKTTTQLDIDDPEVIGALNAVSLAAVQPLQLQRPPVPSDVGKALDSAAAQLAKLAGIEDPGEYAKKKDAIYQPLDGMLLDHRMLPRIIDEAGIPGFPLVDIMRPPRWPELLPPPFVDLRARAAACSEYVAGAAARNRLRVYRNIELSQAYV